MEFKDYYAALGVEKTATVDEIKRAYRKLARKYHPDLNKAADAEARFKDVAEAYEALHDPEKRAAYDALGADHREGRTFTPPPGCPGPWAKVIFSADFTVSAGRQFDRTAKFFLGGANIYFGTTAEPRAALSPSWHVERDLTDLSALFHTPQVGQAILGNFVGVDSGRTYNGIIYANARLDFYPVAPAHLAPTVPNAVLAFPLETPTLAGIAAGWLQILYAGLFSTAVAYTLQAIAQQHVPPSNAAIILSSEACSPPSPAPCSSTNA